jgi:hypothetical protein
VVIETGAPVEVRLTQAQVLAAAKPARKKATPAKAAAPAKAKPAAKKAKARAAPTPSSDNA